jgi:hypothetical protein
VVQEADRFLEMIWLLHSAAVSAPSVSVLENAADMCAIAASRNFLDGADILFRIVCLISQEANQLHPEDVRPEFGQNVVNVLAWLTDNMTFTEVETLRRVLQCGSVFLRFLSSTDEKEKESLESVRAFVQILIRKYPTVMDRLLSSGTEVGKRFQRVLQIASEEEKIVAE